MQPRSEGASQAGRARLRTERNRRPRQGASSTLGLSPCRPPPLWGILAVAACALLGPPTVSGAQPAHPFLQTLVTGPGGITIAFGTEPRSREAADLIHAAACAIPGAERNVRLVSAAEFDAADFRTTGITHVIAVGTLADNAVLQGRNWLPTWWLDRDWYYRAYRHAVPPELALPYQSTNGFFAAGFGEWPTGEQRIGLVEIDRSEYFMEWMVRSRYETAAGGPIVNGNHPSWGKLNTVVSPTYPADFPLRLMVRISGSGGAGVVAAAKAFVDGRLLGGVVLADGAQADPGPVMFTLPASRYATQLPFTPPDGAHGYTCQGWLLPSAFEYDGFRHDAGVAPQTIYRVKYKPDFGITGFWTTPHRRAGQFEVCVVYFATAQEAAAARAGLEQTLARTPGGQEGKVTGFQMAVSGRVLVLESLPEPAGQAILKQYLALPLTQVADEGVAR